MRSFATLHQMLHNGACKKLMVFRHKITSLTHNFRGKPGTSLAIMPVQYSMEQHHKERKRKSPQAKVLTGAQPLTGDPQRHLL